MRMILAFSPSPSPNTYSDCSTASPAAKPCRARRTDPGVSAASASTTHANTAGCPRPSDQAKICGSAHSSAKPFAFLLASLRSHS